MGKVLLGVVITLAILYPTVTKYWLGKGVDVAHSVATTAIEQANKPSKE
jgi:hypothetical protein